MPDHHSIHTDRRLHKRNKLTQLHFLFALVGIGQPAVAVLGRITMSREMLERRQNRFFLQPTGHRSGHKGSCICVL